MNLINRRYGQEPGLTAYTHVSDQFGPFATQTIPATVSEAPYILDGLLMTGAGQNILEQYADTGGFTDPVFAVTALFVFQFISRNRDLPSMRLYLFDPTACPITFRKTSSASAVKAKSATEQPKLSTSAWQASICSPPSLSIGTPSISGRPSQTAAAPVSTVHPTFWLTSRPSDGPTPSSPQTTGGREGLSV